MTENVSRRKFLKTGCIIGAAAGLTVCGGGALAATYRPKIDLAAPTFEGSGAGLRVLVAYTSKAGSTAEIAARVGEKIAKTGPAVDVRRADQVQDISPYQAVVVGSAIYMGQVMPAALSFVEVNQYALRRLPFSVFVVCTTLAEDTPQNRQTVSAYLDPVRGLVKPVSEGLFAGVIDPSRMTLLERLMTQSMDSPVGDFRDWPAIEAWSESALPA